jgi:hypothetical protein
MVACHVRPAGRPHGPQPGGPAQPRRRPVTCGNGVRVMRARGAVTCSTVAQWGLASGKVLPVSTGGVPVWRRAGGAEVGLTLAAARHEGAERWRRRRVGDRCQGREGSGEQRGGPAARGGGEGGGCGAALERRGEITARGRESSAGGSRVGATRDCVADRWGQQHNAPDSVFKPNQVYFKRIQICPKF